MTWFDQLVGTIKEALIKEAPMHMIPQKELIYEAQKWIGVHEVKGKRSAAVDVFRRATNGIAEGENWCAGFVQYCCTAVATRCKWELTIPPSELCSAIWDNTPSRYKFDKPEAGMLVVWNYPGTIFGHIGIVEEVGEASRMLFTIEGNTKPPHDVEAKLGTGVYRKMRTVMGSAEMALLGYIKPFR